MAYCRGFSDGDVYMYYHVNGFIQCCGCRLSPKIKTMFTTGNKKLGIERCKKCGGKGCDCCMVHAHKNYKTRSAAINHLKKHTEAGHNVPLRAIERLEKEIKEKGNKVNS